MNCIISIHWLLYANIAMWVGLSLYMLFIGCKQKKINQQLKKIEVMYHEK